MTDTPVGGQEQPEEAWSAVKAAELQYLDPARIRLQKHGATLRLTIRDRLSVRDLKVYRLFPISDAERYLSLRNGKGEEVGILRDPGALDEDARALLAEALRRRYLLPVIKGISRAQERFGTVEWRVQTDRGERVFTTRNLRDEVLHPAPQRYLIKDVEGNRYDIPDLALLDAASQSRLLQHL